jgi:hypothetical protein
LRIFRGLFAAASLKPKIVATLRQLCEGIFRGLFAAASLKPACSSNQLDFNEPLPGFSLPLNPGYECFPGPHPRSLSDQASRRADMPCRSISFTALLSNDRNISAPSHSPS